ncbi:alpha/beta hydrolase family protein [Uliginosibacterium sp. 31-12]|uniref:alpha/beta hydrolase n=1 Tax=Uliginosibacterium sp. 31-12 TaxID=3062781 RepID=UPI0026E22608|nr:alpha/beta hydrolase-fold protein [Uliginosibacterium sp. 31-12]MDO6386049.1 alpha/beta fold hydrolase [Uliginosibacterium sp. 31-12]
MFRFLLVVVFCLVSNAVLASEVLGRTFYSPVLGRNLNYTVYLPDLYKASSDYYPVVYFFHGHGGGDRSWVDEAGVTKQLDALIAKGEIQPCVAVMIGAGTSWYVDRKEKMESAFFGDFVPEIERSFRVVADRRGRVVAGYSMGGFGALRYSLKNPGYFSAAILLSPAIYTPEPPSNSAARGSGVFGVPFDAKVWKELNYPSILDGYVNGRNWVPMFIASGDDDEFFIEKEAAGLYAILRGLQQPAELRIVNGGHSAVWSSLIGDGLRYAMKFAAQPRSKVQ